MSGCGFCVWSLLVPYSSKTGLGDFRFTRFRLSVKLLCQGHIAYIIRSRHPKFGAWMYFGMAECHIPFLDHCDLDL